LKATTIKGRQLCEEKSTPTDKILATPRLDYYYMGELPKMNRRRRRNNGFFWRLRQNLLTNCSYSLYSALIAYVEGIFVTAEGVLYFIHF